MQLISFVKSAGGLAFFLLLLLSPWFANTCINIINRIEERLARRRKIILPVTLIVYVSVAVFLQIHHAIDGDEGQAWLIARDAGSLPQVYAYMGYEGSPALWHTILFPFIQSGAAYSTIYYINLFFAITAISIWLFYAPFPLLVRILLPFTHIFLTEYAVFARSYALSTCLLFSALTVYRLRPRLWFCWAGLFFLLANTNLHSTILCCGFALFLLLEWIHSGKKNHTRPLIIISAGILLAVIQVFPPGDLDSSLAGFTFKASLAEVTASLITVIPVFSAIIYFILIFQVIRTLNTKVEKVTFICIQAALFSLFLFKYFGAMRHHFFLFFSVLMMLWISSEKHDQRVKTNIFLICLQLFMLNTAIQLAVQVVKETPYTKEMATYIKENITSPRKTFMASYPDNLVVTIAPYVPGRLFYFPQSDRWGSFVIWNKERKAGRFNQDVTEHIADLPRIHKGYQQYFYLCLKEIPADSLSHYHIKEVKKVHSEYIQGRAHEWATYYLYQLPHKNMSSDTVSSFIQ